MIFEQKTSFFIKNPHHFMVVSKSNKVNYPY